MILFQFQAVIQKSSFVIWTLSRIGIRRLRWFSEEGNYKDKHNGQRLWFQRTHFLLEKTCRFLLPYLAFISFGLIIKAIFICITLHDLQKHNYNHIGLHFVFKIGLQPASHWCCRPNTLISDIQFIGIRGNQCNILLMAWKRGCSFVIDIKGLCPRLDIYSVVSQPLVPFLVLSLRGKIKYLLP